MAQAGIEVMVLLLTLYISGVIDTHHCARPQSPFLNKDFMLHEGHLSPHTGLNHKPIHYSHSQGLHFFENCLIFPWGEFYPFLSTVSW